MRQIIISVQTGKTLNGKPKGYQKLKGLVDNPETLNEDIHGIYGTWRDTLFVIDILPHPTKNKEICVGNQISTGGTSNAFTKKLKNIVIDGKPTRSSLVSELGYKSLSFHILDEKGIIFARFSCDYPMLLGDNYATITYKKRNKVKTTKGVQIKIFQHEIKIPE